ncbi:MAG: Smr/MutS family protein [Polyangiaceae bacterium]|nr:Smr/MutS family protein [Polyangiaceae bacterium]
MATEAGPAEGGGRKEVTLTGSSTADEKICSLKTRRDLDWDRLLAHVADRCESERGKRLAKAWPFARVEETRRALGESKEALQLLEKNEEIPSPGIDDVEASIGRLRIGGVLGPMELRSLGRSLASARSVRRFLSARKERCPELFETCSTDPTLDALADELEGSFDPDGTLKDNVTPELKRLREERNASRQRMMQRLEEMMRKYEHVLSDTFVTEREGRFVLPLRSDAHERFQGIVHGTSGSGSTVFVEPRIVIPLGNRLKLLEAQVEAEEQAVYARLSVLLSDQLESVRDAMERLARLDVKRAIARIASQERWIFPEIVESPTFELFSVRHPLLSLDGKKVIASDLVASAGRVLLVSGPNAGGKTVALKSLGLVALMLRAGFPVPVQADSKAGLFLHVASDVGDDQSLQKDLSTFSAHIRNIVDIVRDARHGSLVLLDELAGGTDPREGEALAVGVLDELAQKGAAVIATTHYEGLKMFAVADPRFTNASVALDPETLAPTFRVALGVPGTSSALSVAKRFGMLGSIVKRAEGFLTREELQFEDTVAKLHAEKTALMFAREAAERKLVELEEERRLLEEERKDIRAKENKIVSNEARALVDLIRRSKDEVRTAEARLRKRHIDVAELKEAAKSIDRVASKVAVGGELEHTVPGRNREEPVTKSLHPNDFRIGGRVYVPRLRQLAEIIEIGNDDSIRVAMGPLKIRVTKAELTGVVPDENEAKNDGKKKKVPKDRPSQGGVSGTGEFPVAGSKTDRLEVAIQSADNTIDLRGLRVEDGVGMAMSFVDRTVNDRKSVAYLLHGHGTGALKDAIRKELKLHPSVVHFRGADQNEGGDGVTVVWVS